jgi:hypothetical protein
VGFVDETKDFEQWLGAQMPLISADLDFKHEQMAKDIFMFLRATFYRWAQSFPIVCPDLAKAPSVLAVGDLHVENFGTWRDIDGRLVWGVNDFDEAYPMPYVNDLVRLASSVQLAIETNKLKLDTRVAIDSILEGYDEWLQSGGRPFVLAEKSTWLRLLAQEHLRDPVAFWDKMRALPVSTKPPPPPAKDLLARSFPEPGLKYKLCSRRAGLGSLGRIRLVGIAEWRGGSVAREVKAMANSACVWAWKRKTSDRIYNDEIRNKGVRCPDPAVQTSERWIVRRLSPDCCKISLADMPKQEEARILHAMGRETANIHLGSAAALADVRNDLKKRQKQSAKWLVESADNMVKQLRKDWKDWQGKK